MQQQQQAEKGADGKGEPSASTSEQPDFIASSSFTGVKAGYVFKAGNRGTGYYKDTPSSPAASPAPTASSSKPSSSSSKSSGKPIILKSKPIFSIQKRTGSGGEIPEAKKKKETGFPFEPPHVSPSRLPASSGHLLWSQSSPNPLCTPQNPTLLSALWVKVEGLGHPFRTTPPPRLCLCCFLAVYLNVPRCTCSCLVPLPPLRAPLCPASPTPRGRRQQQVVLSEGDGAVPCQDLRLRHSPRAATCQIAYQSVNSHANNYISRSTAARITGSNRRWPLHV